MTRSNFLAICLYVVGIFSFHFGYQSRKATRDGVSEYFGELTNNYSWLAVIGLFSEILYEVPSSLLNLALNLLTTVGALILLCLALFNLHLFFNVLNILLPGKLLNGLEASIFLASVAALRLARTVCFACWNCTCVPTWIWNRLDVETFLAYATCIARAAIQLSTFSLALIGWASCWISLAASASCFATFRFVTPLAMPLRRVLSQSYRLLQKF